MNTDNTTAQLDPNRDRIFKDLSGLVSFNSPHSTPELADQHSAAADWVTAAVAEHGFEVERHPTVDNADVIIGRRAGTDGAPTVLLYSHYDIVPAGDPAAWTSDPFTLTARDGRWYGRGASDCKGNIAMHLETLRMLEAAGGTDANLLVVVEGSEELGGGGLEKLIDEKPDLFRADVILIADSGNVAVGTPTLTTALRGGAQVRVTMKTLEGAIHSGTFGGAAPDPVAALIRTLDSLRDEHGRTVIDSLDCTQTWEGEPYTAETFRKDGGVLDGVGLMGDAEAGEQPSDLVWARPAVSVTGFTSTPVDQAVNAIVPQAQAQLNLRVPATMDPAEAAEALKQHLIDHTPWGAHVEVEIFDINHGFATDPDRPAIGLLGACLREAYAEDDPAVELAVVASGGSIPLTATLQKHFPDAAIAMFGVEDNAAGIHSVDESVHPYEIERVAVAEALFLQRVSQL
ncbi:M20/M25/M40 family metallo-hydrolase [Corynebacterium sp. CCUG 70398]|uniref:M20/M25/M40 family metallo-hydrolase n=1 Tax=Corynebacterium sp. CCUG 70398 TaxID=2823891 RepID=UPI002108C5CB|nr:M20/M25/M40 family metallo-hydrolase [Corynebacterium sp. CCUG 70398]MCQ4623621.1 M20/M25/M40 family metallo-hydrolase [Corynebacterium sp. CCUG 70398]